MIQKDTTFAFSSCNRKSNIGPNQTEVDNAYKGTNVSVTIIGSGTQKWVVPQTGFYLINAAGAAGISSCSDNIGGNGAQLVSLFEMKKNDVLYILVGQQGITSNPELGRCRRRRLFCS